MSFPEEAFDQETTTGANIQAGKLTTIAVAHKIRRQLLLEEAPARRGC